MAVQGQLGKCVQETLSQKYPTHKKTKAGREAQDAEHLTSKRSALSSNLHTVKTKLKIDA
jgi:hypothetical protein